MAISPLRLSVTNASFPSSSITATWLHSRSSTMPVVLARYSLSAMVRVPMPPVWNVRMVSCVPGSPMDCAAMMPTAMPCSTSLPVDMSMP